MARLPFKGFKKRPLRKPAPESGKNLPPEKKPPVHHEELAGMPVSRSLDANLNLLQDLMNFLKLFLT